MFKTKIPLVGTGPIAETLVVSLRAQGLRPRLIGPLELESSGLHRAAKLILMAQPGFGWQELVERIDLLCVRKRPGRAAPLQVVLLGLDGIGAEALQLPQLPANTRLVLRPFSLANQAARVLLTRYPLHTGTDVAAGQPVHVLIAGFDWLGQAIALQAMRLAHYGGAAPCFTILARKPQVQARSFKLAYAGAGRFCRLQFLELDTNELSPQSPISTVFVCLDDEASALDYVEQLKTLVRRQQSSDPPLFLHVGADRMGGELADWDGQIYPFCPYREACRPEILFGDQGDELATIIHDYYRDTIAAQGRDLASTPAGQPWATLDESYRQASRHQADHLPAKLAAIGCRAATETAAELFLFRPLEVERLAEIEHVRWCADRYLDGWDFGPQRDNQRKLHPDLIPYRDLSEELKDLDRFAVRLLPALLGRLGQVLERDVLVGVTVAGEGTKVGRRFGRSLRRLLQQLRDRFPDRALVLASSLRHPLERLLVRQAIQDSRAVLHFLHSDSVSTIGEDLGSRAARDEFMNLLARAERRFGFADPAELQHWLENQPDILVQIGLDMSVEAPTGAGSSRRVRINQETGATRYSFEY